MASERKNFLLLLGIGLVLAASPARSQSPQISEGVRVTSQVGKIGFGAKGSPYLVNAQPPIYPYMGGADTRLFDGEADLLKFFQSLPPDIQRRGLWVTPVGVPELHTEQDRNRISQLVQEARKKKVLTYVCTAADLGGRSGLVGWECTQQSPSRGSVTLRCKPRDKPHRDHPWWDC